MNIAYHFCDLGNDYGLICARWMIESARRVFDAPVIYHLTDAKTQSLGDVVVRTKEPADVAHIMVHRMMLMQRFLRELDKPVLFVDPDVLFVADPEMAGTWEIGLTHRPPKPGKVYGSMPFNTGVIWAEPESSMFWDRAVEVADAMPKPMKRWYGDQMSIALLIGMNAYDKRGGDLIRWNDLTIKLFPSETHNWTPDEAPSSLTGHRLVHFKGDRKMWMEQALGLVERRSSGSSSATIPSSRSASTSYSTASS